jgi:hypothetical protein
MINYDKYAIVYGNHERKDCDSLLEVAGRLSDVFNSGRDIATVMVIRKDNK